MFLLFTKHIILLASVILGADTFDNVFKGMQIHDVAVQLRDKGHSTQIKYNHTSTL